MPNLGTGYSAVLVPGDFMFVRLEMFLAARRPSQRHFHRLLELALGSAGCSVHSSNAMMTSAPNPICASMELSGVKKREDPSRWERNVTPLSVTLRNSFRLKT